MGGTGTSFGYWVRRRRLALDLTQAALAHRVGCSTAAVKKIEHDERRPSRTMARQLADALGIGPDQRSQFIAAGLGEVAADRLPAATGARDPGPAPPWLSAQLGTAQGQFVGRDGELRRLGEHLNGAAAGRPRVVFVTGEAGQGKTALLREFADRARQAVANLVVARGAGTAAGGHGDPFLMLKDAFRMLVADPQAAWQVDQLTPEQAQSLWEFAPAVARTVQDVGPHLLDVLVPSDTVRERLSLGTAPATAAPDSRDHVMTELIDVLTTLSGQRPLLLLLDDMQWADPGSSELLFHLTRRLADARVLVVCAYRSSEVAGDAGPAATLLRETLLEVRRQVDDSLIDLDDAAPEEERALCAAMVRLEIPDLTAETLEELYRRTRGHPLFVQELVRELKARGDLVDRGDGSWEVRSGLDWNRVPTRVAAVIEQRLHRLDSQKRALLDAAAVEGEHFTAELAATVAGIDERTALRILAELDRIHGLVREASALPSHPLLTRYWFAHALFQRFLYEALGAGARRHSHRALADALAAMDSAHSDQFIPQLAYHYAEARDAERAIPYLLQAGDHARLLHAHVEAVAAYERATGFLRELGDRERLARALMKTGLAYQAGFDHERAQLAFDEAFALWASAAEAPGHLTGTATLRLIWQEPETLDPTMGGYTIAAPVVTNLLSGLVRYDEGTDVVPDVARRWQISSDGRRYTFELRDDAVWSDGRPVTSDDFVFTYRRALDPTTTGAKVAPALLDAVTGADDIRSGRASPDQAGVHAADSHTLVIELTQPTSYFIYNLAYYVLLPVPRHAVEAHGADWCRPDTMVTNGPFRLVAWSKDEMVLERSASYHGVAKGNVRRVTLDLASTAGSHAAHYLADDVDVLSSAWFTDLETIERLRRRFPHEYSRRDRFVTVYYWVAPNVPPLNDRRVRQAMAMAVDREAMAVRAAGLQEPGTGGMVPPGMPGHVPDLAGSPDPAEAARRLAEALGADLPPITIMFRQRVEPQARQLQADWQALGLRVELAVLDPGEDPFHVWADIDGPKVAVGGWVADYPDADTFLRVNVELDLPEWRHGRYQRLLSQAARTTDPAARDAIYQRAERILADEAVVVPLAYEPEHLMVKPWIKHYPSVPVKYPGFWKDVTVGPQ